MPRIIKQVRAEQDLLDIWSYIWPWMTGLMLFEYYTRAWTSIISLIDQIQTILLGCCHRFNWLLRNRR